MVQVGDRVRFVHTDIHGRDRDTLAEDWRASFGIEGTIIEIARSNGGLGSNNVAISWDRGRGPNNYLNPDRWWATLIDDKEWFEILSPKPHDWEEFLELV